MASEKEQWQLDADTPELYESYLVPAITSLWAADLIDRAAPRPTDRLLDIACGTGAVTRLAAERVTTGRVVGLDLNPGMLKVARSIPTSGASKIEWCEGSAQDLPFSNHSFHLVLCQLGLQFFPDRALALREMRRVLVPYGRLALNVYSAIEQTPAAHAFVRALDQHFGPDASSTKRTEHVFRDRDELSILIAKQGFEEVTVSTVTMMIRLPSVEDYVRFQLLATPMAGLLTTLDTQAREGNRGRNAAD
jgi:ubiquinone/menaquinone biosynthesis C-methylase UbiE